MRHDPPFLFHLASLALAGCMTLLAVDARAQAEEAAATGRESGRERMRFDISRQPLNAALDQYGLHTGLPVFFDAGLVAGRESTPVQTTATPAEALRTLLRGTGLVADYTGTGTSAAFVLKPMPADAVDSPARTAPGTEAATPAAPADRGSYDGLVQTRIWEAFCGNPRTVPGGYRAAMRFVIDGTGRIANAFLLHTSGDRARDGAILDTLRQIRIDRAPPPEMAQPLTMLILPRSQTPGLECPARH
jgi:hypothetical protein